MTRSLIIHVPTLTMYTVHGHFIVWCFACDVICTKLSTTSPSYTPLYTPSYTPSYTPPYTPSYTPPSSLYYIYTFKLYNIVFLEQYMSYRELITISSLLSLIFSCYLLNYHVNSYPLMLSLKLSC